MKTTKFYTGQLVRIDSKNYPKWSGMTGKIERIHEGFHNVLHDVVLDVPAFGRELVVLEMGDLVDNS